MIHVVACALSGLRELVDYLPATIATIVSYCFAEVTRGLWKYASMNGQDWPSPAGNLLAIQGEVKDILAAAGVHTTNPTGNAAFRIWHRVYSVSLKSHQLT